MSDSVYVTATGDTYHRTKTCSNVQSIREVSVKEAVKEGNRRCSNCYCDERSSCLDPDVKDCGVMPDSTYKMKCRNCGGVFYVG